MEDLLMTRLFKMLISIILAASAIAAQAHAKTNDDGCDNRRLALSTFITSCAAWKGVHQTNRNDSFNKQKSDCREISKEFADWIFRIAPKGCEFTYAPTLIRAFMNDKDVKAFAASL